MIKVTIEYNSVSEAIVGLGKLISAAPGVRETPVARATPAPAPAAAEPNKRKGRTDKGKKRGSYKNAGDGTANPAAASSVAGDVTQGVESKQTQQPSPAPQTAAPAPTTNGSAHAGSEMSPGPKTASPDPASAPTAAPEVTSAATAANAQMALEKLFETKGLQAAQSVLSAFGIQRLRDLKPEDHAAFIEKAGKAAA